jgi:hypothetical protein
MKLPRYVQAWVDRETGHSYHYFRRPGFKRVPLPGLPWSPQFMEAYQAALEAAPRLELGASRTMPGTVNNAIILYVQSTAFDALAPSTRAMRRAVLERFRAAHGDKRLAMMRSEHLSGILNTLKPSAQRNMLKTLRGLLAFAVEHKMIAADLPTPGTSPWAAAGSSTCRFHR